MAASENIRIMPRVILSARNARNQKQSADRAQAIASALAAVLLACGGPILFAGCMTLPTLVATLIAATVVGALAGALSVIGPIKRIVPLGVVAVSALALILLLAVPDARGGMFSMYNALASRFDDAFYSYAGLVQGYGTVAASPLFGACLGTLTATAAWGFTRLRTTGVTLLMLVTVCGFGLRLSSGIGTIGCAVGIAGWLTQCRYIKLRGSMCSTKSLLADLGINAVMCVGVFVIIGAIFVPSAAVDNAHNAMWNAINHARYGEETLPEGDMGKAAHLNDQSDATLRITPEGTFSDDMLLRGFVGANFSESERWSALDHTAYEGSWSGIMSWLSAEDLTPAMQRAAYDDANANRGGVERTEVSTVSVDAGNAYRGYTFAPYTMRSLTGSNANLNLDGTLQSGLVGSRSYRFEMDNVATANVLDDASWLESADSPYASTESVYAAFAKERYLDVPDDEAGDIKRLVFNDATWDSAAASSEFAVISRVRTMMDTLASYTESPKTMPAEAGSSFASWFFEQAREGNSSYFATAATLAFRTQGIPARYVEGYRVGAGDLTGAALTNSTLTLDHGNAHAWCEIYLDGLGWTPVEVAPGFYTQAFEPDAVIDVGETWSSGASDQVLQTGSIAGQTNDNQDNGNESDAAASVLDVLRGVLVTLAIIAALVAAAFIQRAVRINKRKQRIAADDQAISVPALYNYLAAVMISASVGFNATKPLDNLDGLCRAFPGVDVMEFRRVIEIHQAYAFGGHVLKPNEMRTLRRLTERLHEMLPACANARERLKRYFIEAL